MARGTDQDSILTGGEQSRPARRWVAHAVWAGAILVPFLVWMAILSQSELPPGQCSGIGWGCSLAGWDAVGVAAVIVGIPLLVLLLAGHIVIGIVQMT